MKYDDVVGMVTTSGVSDWQQIDGGRFFIYELGEYSSAEGRGVSVEYHHSLGVYRGDVGLRLAWGLEEDRDLQFEGMSFPDKQIWRCFADAFWQGALVARWRYLLVDGGRCSLPEVHQAYDGVEEHPGDPAKWTFRRSTARMGDVAVARLVDGLSGRSEFDSYMSRAGIAVVAD